MKLDARLVQKTIIFFRTWRRYRNGRTEHEPAKVLGLRLLKKHLLAVVGGSYSLFSLLSYLVSIGFKNGSWT